MVLNHFVNMLGYNPGNVEHGYLWWLAWLDHNARTLFSLQDANGDFRPLFLQASCATYTQLIDNLNAVQSGLGSEFESVLNITPIIGADGICPTQARRCRPTTRSTSPVTRRPPARSPTWRRRERRRATSRR